MNEIEDKDVREMLFDNLGKWSTGHTIRDGEKVMYKWQLELNNNMSAIQTALVMDVFLKTDLEKVVDVLEEKFGPYSWRSKANQLMEENQSFSQLKDQFNFGEFIN